MDNIIIGIHGLKNKPEKNLLEAGWKAAIQEGLSKNEGIKKPKLNFSSVYWADIFYKNVDKHADLYKEAKENSLQKYKKNFSDKIRKFTLGKIGYVSDFIEEKLDLKHDCILNKNFKDLYEYYSDMKKRNLLRERLESIILQHHDKKIMVVSHSMGTIIAYDVLRGMLKKHSSLRIEHLVTLGSPLGFPHVKKRTIQENPLIRTPSIVDNWSNFSDTRDFVAIDMYLSGDYAANDHGVVVEDHLVTNDWDGDSHKSYGYLRTPEVSKVIKNFIF